MQRKIVPKIQEDVTKKINPILLQLLVTGIMDITWLKKVEKIKVTSFMQI